MSQELQPLPFVAGATCNEAANKAVTLAIYMQVLNKVVGQRFELQESLKKLQDCINLLEKEHAWHSHVEELTVSVQQHQAVVQVHACTAL